MADSIIKFERRCPDCGEVKPITDFPRNRSRFDGRGVYCKPCHNTRTLAYYRTPRGTVARAESRRATRDRARARYDEAVAQLTPAERALLGR